MTDAQARDLQTKWETQGDPPPLCTHPIQELSRLSRAGQGYMGDLVGLYHCRACGEAFVRTTKPQPLPTCDHDKKGLLMSFAKTFIRYVSIDA